MRKLKKNKLVYINPAHFDVEALTRFAKSVNYNVFTFERRKLIRYVSEDFMKKFQDYMRGVDGYMARDIMRLLNINKDKLKTIKHKLDLNLKIRGKQHFFSEEQFLAIKELLEEEGIHEDIWRNDGV